MMWTEKNIFEPSGCITREAFKALLDGELLSAVKDAAEAHIAGCPFCSDARDGIVGSKSSYKEILNRIDKDFHERHPAVSPKRIHRKVWISAIAAAASILLIISISQLYKNGIKPEQVALNKEEKTDSSVKVSPPAMQPNNQIALHSEPAKLKRNDFLPAKKSEIPVAEENVEGNDRVIALDSDAEPELSIAAVVDAPAAQEVVAYSNKKYSDTLGILKEEAKAAAPAGYVAYVGEMKEDKYKEKKGSVAKVRSAKQEIPSLAPVEAADEQPRFQYFNFTDFGKYIESQFPAIKDSSGLVNVIVEITIDEKGSVSDARIIRGINSETERAILLRIKNSPSWIPAKKFNKEVVAKLIFTIKYSTAD